MAPSASGRVVKGFYGPKPSQSGYPGSFSSKEVSRSIGHVPHIASLVDDAMADALRPRHGNKPAVFPQRLPRLGRRCGEATFIPTRAGPIGCVPAGIGDYMVVSRSVALRFANRRARFSMDARGGATLPPERPAVCGITGHRHDRRSMWAWSAGCVRAGSGSRKGTLLDTPYFGHDHVASGLRASADCRRIGSDLAGHSTGAGSRCPRCSRQNVMDWFGKQGGARRCRWNYLRARRKVAPYRDTELFLHESG